MQRYVLGFLFDNDRSTVALIRKNKPDWQRGKLNGIGGKIELGEPTVGAMTREFFEEAGVRIEGWNQFAVMQGSDWMVHCFRAFDDAALRAVRSMTDEQVERHYTGDIMQARVISNLTWLIPLALDRGSEPSGQNGPFMSSVLYA